MATDHAVEPLPITPVVHERHVWRIADDAPVSRSARSRSNGEHDSTIPPRMAEYRPLLPADLGADMEDAAASAAAFDSYVAERLGAGQRVIGPMSTILLRAEAQSSSQIERLTVGAEDLALMGIDCIDEGRSDNARVVYGDVQAIKAALSMADSIDEAHVLAMHRALLSAQRGWEGEAGHYRSQLVWVGTNSYSPVGAAHVAPQPELVPALMGDLMEFVEREDLPVIAQCAIAHVQFETIHPFADGNGRFGRALIHAILRNKGLIRHATLPLSAGLLTMTDEYFGALTAYRAGDARLIVERFADACRFAASSGRRLVDALFRELALSEEQLHGVGRDAAVWSVPPVLVAQPVVNANYLMTHLGMSNVTAHRTLDTLVSRGVLVQRSGGRRNRVWEHSGMLRILDEYAARLHRG